MPMRPSTDTTNNHSLMRIRLWYGLIVIVMAIFGIRLFYLEIIRYDYYRKTALNSQLKQYQIPAERGLIKAHDRDGLVPVVLNQTLYTLFADPKFIKNPEELSYKVQKIIGGRAEDYENAMKQSSRYVVLAHKLKASQKKRIEDLHKPGLGTQAVSYRTYPQSTLASQLLGFVNDNGNGKYGVEQALEPQLRGTPGQLRAVTDVNGVPLAATKDNVETEAVAGKDIVLTINLGVQAQLEKILKQYFEKTESKGLNAVIIDPNSGQVKAMANYPTYNPAVFSKVSDQTLFQNGTVSNAIEPGSIMKLLTTSAALDQDVITPTTSFYDPSYWEVDGFTINDIEERGAKNQTIATTLNLSLNTGATWMLMQMGGGEINSKARNAWYDYMVNHFQLGKQTGIEQGYEAAGFIPLPKNNGAGINLTYANSSFGQAVTMTPLQMAGAVSSVLNGGTYYQPTIIDQTISASGKVSDNSPKIVKQHVVSSQVGIDLKKLMEYVIERHYAVGFNYLNFSSSYSVGGKTGTAQIANPSGGYYSDKFNGTYVGFVGGDRVEYVIVIYNMQPVVPGYAGSFGGQPVFADIAHMLIDNGYVTPKNN